MRQSALRKHKILVIGLVIFAGGMLLNYSFKPPIAGEYIVKYHYCQTGSEMVVTEKHQLIALGYSAAKNHGKPEMCDVVVKGMRVVVTDSSYSLFLSTDSAITYGSCSNSSLRAADALKPLPGGRQENALCSIGRVG